MALANMTQAETNEYNRNHCKLIADELDAIAQGLLYKCSECGNIVNINDVLEDSDDIYGTCTECEELASFEQLSAFDYFEDVYDIKYTVDANREYFGVCLMVACGGPNIYVDTVSGQVELYWWGDKASYPLSSDAQQLVDEFGEELYNC